jgi:hypothetical protein
LRERSFRGSRWQYAACREQTFDHDHRHEAEDSYHTSGRLRAG